MSEKKIGYTIKCLDKGYIELVDTLGDDLTPVNAARVSFGGRSDDFTDKDRRLSKLLLTSKDLYSVKDTRQRFYPSEILSFINVSGVFVISSCIFLANEINSVPKSNALHTSKPYIAGPDPFSNFRL